MVLDGNWRRLSLATKIAPDLLRHEPVGPAVTGCRRLGRHCSADGGDGDFAFLVRVLINRPAVSASGEPDIELTLPNCLPSATAGALT